MHKLIVAQRRVGPGNAKRPKDLLQSEVLLDHLVKQRPNELRDVWRDADKRSSKWSNYMRASLTGIDPAIRDRVLAIVGKVSVARRRRD